MARDCLSSLGEQEDQTERCLEVEAETFRAAEELLPVVEVPLMEVVEQMPCHLDLLPEERSLAACSRVSQEQSC